jgi:hypothetical protein
MLIVPGLQGIGVGRFCAGQVDAFQQTLLYCQHFAHSHSCTGTLCYACSTGAAAAFGAQLAAQTDDKTHPSRPKAGPCVCASSSGRVQHAHVSASATVTTALRGRAAVSMALRFAKATRSKVMSAGSQSRVYRDVNVHKPQVSAALSSDVWDDQRS